MLKSIDNPLNQTDSCENAKQDAQSETECKTENETKTEIESETSENERNTQDKDNTTNRRESIPEDATLLSSKLNTIEEACEFPKTSHALNSSFNSKAQRHDNATTTTTLNTTDTTTTTTAAEQQQQTLNVNNGDNVEYNNVSIGQTQQQQQQQQQSDSSQNKEIDSSTITTTTTIAAAAAGKQNRTPSPVAGHSNVSPLSRRKSSSGSGTSSIRGSTKLTKAPSSTKIASRSEEDTISKSSDTSGELIRGIPSTHGSQADSVSQGDKPKNTSRLSERVKKKSWYNVLYPNYKSRSQDFKKLFKEVPNDERLIVDYSCALQRDILVQGRLYVSQNYVCFHANILGWETYLCIKWKDVTSITKEKTALVIPNAISICTAKEKYFFATFTTRDKAFLMLFRVWQNTLMNKPMLPQEMWQWVHNCYGDELGLTTDDEDYIDPTSVPTEIETDADFVSATDDTRASDYSTARSNSNQSINLTERPSTSGGGNQLTATTTAGGSGGNSSGGSSTGAGGDNTGVVVASGSGAGGGESVTKSKTRSYFFSKSNLNSSNTASASGSDNKASDTNTNNGANKRASSGSGNNSNTNTNANTKTKSTSKMKVNAKELTLFSAKPDENFDATQNVNGSGGGTAAGAGSGVAANSAKETTKTATINSNAVSGDGKRKVSKLTRQREETNLTKNSEASPTDISDSSDSDENKIPFVATAECTSPHEGRQLMHTILPINIDTLFNLLFSKSKFLVDFHDMRKSTDTNFGEWKTNEDGLKTRTVNITVQLSASVGPKASKVTESQVMRECSKPGELYSIDINSVNAGIPYADSFSVLMHYCLVRTVDDHTMLSVHAQIKYKKSVWGVVKGFIEKNTWAGLEDFFTALLHSLQSETCIPPAKGKGRRPRRGTATQIRPLEELPPALVKTEPAERAHTPHATVPAVPTRKAPAVEQGTTKNRWLSVFVILLLCFLIVLNVILLLKLWRLEERIEDDLTQRTQMPNLSSLKKLPNTHQDWIELLRQQELLHETELKKWHRVLQTAIELLKKTEKTLASLIFR